ncbi:PocR ligand-binding domain-containing protein [Clostridium saccharobutylicum]|uniref:Sensor domain protein n=1 Tax=Clostridium saccharobutylicum DSM 13864 TaxID=1345695 RepID=U5MXE3_CLOSA|nr:PocR ligand-binding domain-containing protein [Clostridium saccharobutylicum]AGX45218.1 sensor domain protein [Clostridium saccharobutylicum DSM 13864]AQR92495.1 putative sensory transducer protein YfmS [Clostridium saccharobutylicum]AQS02398.1 putative sensory transducer protein YfmS [Clostridium saccharobutylicum]AQS12003.1 putative sensory transducer protein YfmS [Clostridium saccharobutylicum]AQS16381.1 putative sensory transducer protein YfmS [Clostridium saccharobutylicum]
MKSDNKELNHIQLKDIVDLNFLQKFQDDFAESMDIAAITVDKSGKPVTKPSRYTKICMNYTQSVQLGKNRCAQCHSDAGVEAFKNKRPYIYTCHSGLIDFAAPIIVEGELVGTILGGQVSYSDPNEEKFKQTANELGLDENQYYNAAKEVKIIEERKVKSAAEVLFSVANTLSRSGYHELKIKEMTSTLMDNFEQISSATQQLAASSMEVTQNQGALNNEIENVQGMSNEINNILGYIKDIANQTKMLGLNAAIEAARVGDLGKGFNVVATEIRKLSESSKETAINISTLTEKIQFSINKTFEMSNNTLEITEQQSAAIEETNASIEELTSFTTEMDKLVNEN